MRHELWSLTRDDKGRVAKMEKVAVGIPAVVASTILARATDPECPDGGRD